MDCINPPALTMRFWCSVLLRGGAVMELCAAGRSGGAASPPGERAPRPEPAPQPGSRCASPPLRMFPAYGVLLHAVEGNIRSPADRRV
jgi:hypothetical protein